MSLSIHTTNLKCQLLDKLLKFNIELKVCLVASCCSRAMHLYPLSIFSLFTQKYYPEQAPLQVRCTVIPDAQTPQIILSKKLVIIFLKKKSSRIPAFAILIVL